MPAMCFLHGFLKLLQKQISLRIVCVSLAHKPAYPGKLPRELTKRLASKKWPQKSSNRARLSGTINPSSANLQGTNENLG